MTAFRKTDYVQTVTLSKNGHRLGRKPKPKGAKVDRRVQLTMTRDEATAFERWMAREGVRFESVAGMKMILDRLKTDGFLTADGKLPKPSHD